jgi:PST family polysaccharide transporter
MTISTISGDLTEINWRTARGAVVAVGSQVLIAAIQLVNIIVLSRLLGPSDFGLMAMSATITAFVALFRDLGLSTATIQRKNLDQDTASGIFLINVSTAVVLMLLVCASAPFAALALGDPRLVATLVVSSGTLPIAALGAQHAAQFARNLQFLTIQWIAVAGAVAGSIGAIFLAAYGAGYWALLANAWITASIQAALLWTWSPWRPTRVQDWSVLRSAIDFGASLTASSLIIYFSRQFDKLLVGYRFGAEELGYYSRAYAILLIPQTLVSGPVSSALLPGLSRLQAQPSDWRELILSGVRITTAFTLFIAALLIANADDVVRIMLGSQWEASASLVAIFGMSMIARAVMNQNPWIYLSLGNTRRMLAWQTTTLPIYLGAMVIGLPYGIEGVAMGFSLAQLVLCVPSVFAAAAGTPISGAQILRSVFPMGLITLLTIVVSPLLRIPVDDRMADILVGLINLAVTSSVFVIGAALVLWIDPEYRKLKGSLLRLGHQAFLFGVRRAGERPT